MAIAAARWRLWRGLTTAAVGVEEDTGALLARLVAEPEHRVKATMEEASSASAPGAFWEPLAAALLRASSPVKAHLVLEWKLEKLVKEAIHDCEPYTVIIRYCRETKNAAFAMKVFECVEELGIQLNTGIFNALIDAFLSVGDLLAATTLYETMEDMEDCKPNSATYDAFISAFSRLGSSHAMMSWYLASKDAGFTPSIEAFESLITGFVKLNRLDDAELVFEEMICFEIKPNIAILETKLVLLSRRKDPNRVKVFLELLSDGNQELSEATVERLTRLCLYEDKTDELEQLLSLVQGMHLGSLTKLHCGIVRFYANADRLSDMEHAIFRMLDNGIIFACSEDVEAVICSYFRHKDFDRLDLFLNQIQSLYKLTRSTYDVLISGYQRFNLHGRLDSAIKDMRDAGFV
ncbi:pentatricopeptide repeat-containing protein At2g30780-like [Oryza brachyantha]|uniref:Pentatricopeptide repeat-containing protein-mitochondrial domain-containing protein n=1 Tax=Oryza brachyantha TaxID=4533 RepID=J3LK75_ORYBR|nr:pentatricopeptide repeat-containing protein At2g30780-like [Oryza brachyantha]